MSARKQIVDALVAEIKTINGTDPYTTNVYDNVVNKHKFWDEVKDFPFCCVVAGQETRQYLPGDFKWGYLGVSIKLYVKGEEPSNELESFISDIEVVLSNCNDLNYGTGSTAQLSITSIVTDEGLLVPYGIAEVNITVQYQVL